MCVRHVGVIPMLVGVGVPVVSRNLFFGTEDLLSVESCSLFIFRVFVSLCPNKSQGFEICPSLDLETCDF